MRSLTDQNHYEVLEISRSSETPEIERAYRTLLSVYASDSLALYSVFDEPDAAAVKERLELAYQVLRDADKRRAYDEEIDGWPGETGRVPAARDEGGEAVALEAHDPTHFDDEAAEAALAEPASPGGVELAGVEGFQDLEGDAEEGDDFDGARLRRERLRRGIELDQVASMTKVSSAFLRGIEEEAYDDLPAPVYVRGFLIAYARAIGLDAAEVAASYMGRLEESKRSRPRSRLLGRR